MSERHGSITRPFIRKMLDEGLPEPAVESFALHLGRLASGEPAFLSESQIRPVDDLPDACDFSRFAELGARSLGSVVVVKLNGGLGTSMGLDQAKSLVQVREGLTFLDLIVRQVEALREKSGAAIPLLLMNSYRTREGSLRLLQRYPGIALAQLPLDFLQHRVPKVLADGLTPATHPADPDLEWCPPGHGDLFAALLTSGVLRRLLETGHEYAFVSNADNLGASVDPELLGYMVATGATFLMEAADRTSADRKGGHVCRLADGRLTLRESAQCRADEVEGFQDIALHRFFNTNNLWIHLPTLQKLLGAHGGVLPLPTIVNRKNLDPRDPDSAAVIQLETAAGAALSLFPDARAVRVPRSRFSPVKTTSDLLSVRSDAYILDPEHRLVLDPRRESPPDVDLDPRFFKLLDAFDQRFAHGPPSLLHCRSLEVRGNVFFGAGIIARDDVRLSAPEALIVLEAGTVLEGDVAL